LQPLYSLALAKFLPPDALEAVSLCNRPDAKVLYLGADASAPPLKKTWKRQWLNWTALFSDSK